MIQATEWRAAAETVASPCVDVCQLGGDGVCEGCLRTADEIARWPAMAAEDRIRVLSSLDRRRTGDGDL
ncbi:MAG: DUF1289 domain-containing protein [Chromatiales bacterium]|nr:DUF1289 domain-containing protein [Chromatiales bacterium]